MNVPLATLVIVAYKMDEALFFSSVCQGADLVIVGSTYECGCTASDHSSLPQSAALLGVRRVLDLGFAPNGVFPSEAVARRLRSAGSYGRIYTHSPLDDNGFRVDTALIACKVFSSVSVLADGSPATETHTLSRDLFLRKMDIVNQHYSHTILPERGGCSLTHHALSGVEAFSQVTCEDVVKAVAVTRGDVLDKPDVWGFETSSYECRRLAVTCQLLSDVVGDFAVKEILEIGACEGVMTARLRIAFPNACIRAVEPHPFFAEKLLARFNGDERVQVLASCPSDIALQADVIVLTETLYYMNDESARETLKRLSAKYLVISNGYRDGELCQALHAFGWRQFSSQRVIPQFEGVNGENSNLISLRSGTVVRVWTR